MSKGQGDFGGSLGVLEVSSIARAVRCVDAVCKRATVQVLSSKPISSGKHLIYLRGGVADMEEAMAAGLEVAEGFLIDSLRLSMADLQIWPILPNTAEAAPAAHWTGLESVIVIETATICAALAAVDTACKTTDVILRDIQLGMGIAGKAYFTLTGDLCDVEAAGQAAAEIAGDRLVQLEVIASPAPEIVGRLVY